MMCAERVSQPVMEIESLPPDRALSLLSNETRIEILRVLAVAEEETVPFSTLRKRVGTDDSGQFNYHLNRLTGHYVQRTTDGYALCQAGIDALEAISQL
jgi:DNA-binding transcriptional ArsR family regulator